MDENRRTHDTADRKAMTSKLRNNLELWRSICGQNRNTVDDILDCINFGATDLSYDTGLCNRLATIRVTATVIKALEANMLLDCAKALHEGESKRNIVRAMYRDDTSNLFMRTNMGRHILEELERIEQSDDPDAISVDYSQLCVDLI